MSSVTATPESFEHAKELLAEGKRDNDVHSTQTGSRQVTPYQLVPDMWAQTLAVTPQSITLLKIG